jgi:hypothetical protein
LSVEVVHERSILVDETTVALRLAGTLGGWVSGAGVRVVWVGSVLSVPR